MNNKNDQNDLPPLDAAQHDKAVADFSAVKQSFEQSVQGLVPPKFLWDTIDQELQADLDTDAPETFSSIKEGFEDSFKLQHAPSFTWDALDKESDVPEEDFSAIKKSFERQYSSIVVPLFTWEELTQRMDEDAAYNDAPESYSRVRDSFAAAYAHQKPVATVWHNILRHFHPRMAWWHQYRRSIGVALIIVGLLAGGAGAWWINSTHPTTPSTIAFKADASELLTQRGQMLPSHTHKTTKATVSKTYTTHTPVGWQLADGIPPTSTTEILPSGAAWTPTVPLVLRPAASPLRTTIDPMTGETVDALQSVGKGESEGSRQQQNQQQALNQRKNPLGSRADRQAKVHYLREPWGSPNTNHTPSTLGVPNNSLPSTQQPKGAVAESLILAESQKGMPFQSAPTAPLADHNIASESAKTEQPLLSLLGKTPEQEKTLEQLVHPATIEAADQGLFILSGKWQNQLNSGAMNYLEEQSFMTTRKALIGKRLRIEVGVVGRFGTSLLLRPQRQWHHQSDRVFHWSSAFGLTGQLYFGQNDALILTGYPFTMTWHGLKEEPSDNHPQQRTDVEFCFTELALGYQRILWRYSMIGNAPSRVYARGDLGVAWLTKSNTRLHHGPRHQEAWYNRLQYSFGLGFGTTHTFGNIIVDYGISAQLGLNSIVSPQHPSLLNPTRLLQVGGQVSLRYLLTPRLAPSKRMRQFDWSPPFYIEEPIF